MAAPAVEAGRRELDTIAALYQRDEPTTTDSTSSEQPTATTTDKQSTTATTTGNTSVSATSESTSVATSAVLALIGIRKPRVYIFLSTALLAALGVTVLIEYVMTPPVSNAVQGGYLAAVFFTGIVFGGLALVFKEITEGLCCLLGGFCIGMWFLTLKSGGLVTEQGSKIGFIVAFTLGFYCLSFSHHTRSYGSIVCTSFAGATALVLGIDCFSRAGLKEFWLYIWGLNDDMFPLNTDTYPITRNIRVEIAITIIVAIFGVIAQMRLWKMIKERRAKEESARLEEQRRKDEADVEAGRQLEEKNLKERSEWEQMYGNGADAKEPSMTETAVAEDSRRGSEGYGSTMRENENSFEMKEITSAEQSIPVSDSGRTLDAVDEVESESVLEEHHPSRQEPQQDSQDQYVQETSRSSTPVSRKRSMPEIVVREDNDSEHGAVVGSEAGTLYSKRFSGTSLVNRLSWRSGYSKRNSQSQEALVADDATSSVAGIVDDLQSASSHYPSVTSDHRRQEEDVISSTTKTGLGFQDNPEKVTEREEANAPSSQAQQDKQPAADTTSDKSAESHQIKAKNEPVPAHTDDSDIQQTRPAPSVSPELSDHKSAQLKDEPIETVPAEAETEKPTPATASAIEEHLTQHEEVAHDSQTIPESKATEIREKEIARLDRSTVQSIPEQTSKMIHSFRTREWAKHLADAEMPDPEPLQFDSESEEDPATKDETVAPIDVDGLLQTALNAQPPPAVNSPPETEQSDRQSRISAVSSPEIPGSKKRHSMRNLLGARSPNSSSRNVSSPAMSPLEPEDSHAPMRSSSTPHLTITSPGEINEAKESPRWSGPPPLLAVRENMVRNRMSSTSLRYDPWAGRNQSRHSVASPDLVMSPPLSIPDEKDEESEQSSRHDEDDLPLSKRRIMLQRHSMQSPSEASIHSSESPRSPRSPQYTTADDGRSASRMAAWRQSVREDLSQRRNPLALNTSSPGSPTPDRPQSLWGSVQQMRDASSTQVGNAIAHGMQRGNMTDLHRQAMRRMQASANRNPSDLPLRRGGAPVEATSSLTRAQRRQCVPLSGPSSFPAILRPPAVRLANPVNHVPRVTPITVPANPSDESLPIASPLLSIPEQRRSRLTPSPNSLLVERSQGETESGRTSIALPPRHRRSDPVSPTVMAAVFAGSAAREVENLRPPEEVHLAQDGTRRRDHDLPRHAQSQTSLRSQSQIASVPSHTGQPPADIAEELAWGPAHPCYPHLNPHVPIGSQEYLTTRVIRIRRDWMIKGDLAPTFSNLYPEILDPLLSEQEFRKVIATVNDGVVKAFDPYSLRNWFDGAMGLLTGWVWDDIHASGIKSQLQHVETWLEKWNREVGSKDGVHIWSLRRTAYMSIDIQIPDPKVGIVPSEAPSLPNTRPSTGVGPGN
ncbi:Golgin subfamily A member 7/ERF4 [Penicillium capsulatum]|uniref:Golgin subfamily A member 7/ERF4 n=1 Tax=Penicillium capsulatum TaxID=69766 RepID=A0A9W9IPN8_9EURO|nr:Golgin subfamily A member 7/ERF4 [Penicillium capsulatum]